MYHVKDDKRSRQSAAWIFDALAALMEEKDYALISVTELVQRAGLGRATFYRHFDTVDDVLRMRCDEKFAQLTELMLQSMKKTTRIASQWLQETYRLFFSFWDRESDILMLCWRSRCFFLVLDAFQQLNLSVFSQVQRLAPQLLPEEVDPVMRDYIFSMSTGGILGVLIRWLMDGKRTSPEELAAFLGGSLVDMARRAHELLGAQGDQKLSSSLSSPVSDRAPSDSSSSEA